MRDEMQQAVKHGMSEALSTDAARQFWAIGLEVLRQEASNHTGKFVLDGLVTIVKKGFWIVVFLVAVYSFGGWAMVKTMAAAIFGKN